MPSLTVKKNSKLPAADAFSKVKTFLSSDKDLKKLDPSYACDFNDDDLTGTAKGKLFKAAMTVKTTSSGSHVEITVDLPLTLALAKGMVEKTLQKKLDDSLS